MVISKRAEWSIFDERQQTGVATIAPVAPPPRRLLALDDSKAADVIELAVELWRVTNPEFLGDLVQHTWPWTAAANGVGAGEDYEPGERAFEWNHAYFPAALAPALLLGRSISRRICLSR